VATTTPTYDSTTKARKAKPRGALTDKAAMVGTQILVAHSVAWHHALHRQLKPATRPSKCTVMSSAAL